MHLIPSYGSGSIIMWGRISYTARMELLYLFDRGSLTSPRNITDILEPCVLPFTPYVGDIFVLMQYNVRLHAARCVADYLQTTRIRTLCWFAYSPDLNPMKRRLRRLDHPSQILIDLSQTVARLWEELPQDTK